MKIFSGHSSVSHLNFKFRISLQVTTWFCYDSQKTSTAPRSQYFKGIVRFFRSGNRLSIGQMWCDQPTKARMWLIRVPSIHLCAYIISYPLTGMRKTIPKSLISKSPIRFQYNCGSCPPKPGQVISPCYCVLKTYHTRMCTYYLFPVVRK